MATPRDVLICETGPRDGLQLVRGFMPTAAKQQWLRALAEAGLAEIEVSSFVPAKNLPQFADAAEVTAWARQELAGVTVAALAPNRRGAERAIAAAAQSINGIVSATEAHSQANTNRSRAQQLDILREIRAAIDFQEQAHRPWFCAAIPMSFGCSITGRVAEAEVCGIAAALAELGVDEIALADTVGYADPVLIRHRVRAVRAAVGGKCVLRLHLHDTMGTGLANVLAGLEAGITRFDSAQGGLGGCPHAPGASGNIATEDLVYMLEQMGLRTCIDLARLLAAADLLAAALPGEHMASHVRQAGIPRVFGAAA